MNDRMLVGICGDCQHCARLRCVKLDPSEPVPIAYYCKWRNMQLTTVREKCTAFRAREAAR